MALTFAEKVQLRRWMGADLLYQQHDNRFESAMTTIENIVDGDATVDHVRVLLVEAAAIYQSIADLRNKHLALDVDEVKVDAPRAMLALRSDGRMISTQMAHVFGFFAPLRDAWAGASPDLTQNLANADHHNH